MGVLVGSGYFKHIYACFYDHKRIKNRFRHKNQPFWPKVGDSGAFLGILGSQKGPKIPDFWRFLARKCPKNEKLTSAPNGFLWDTSKHVLWRNISEIAQFFPNLLKNQWFQFLTKNTSKSAILTNFVIRKFLKICKIFENLSKMVPVTLKSS